MNYDNFNPTSSGPRPPMPPGPRSVTQPAPTKPATGYIVVSDHNNEVLKSTPDWYEAVKMANLIRRGGGSVTIFKSTNG
jgi:hypothetical protein